ncbi:uncharacterized protein [Nicotiana tomentosiformis]|uniref:uncharacterized protein n=1 Tax=Nicotiana tomentosiformis TaxID=4098 RepID=UPI00388C54B3
MGSLAYIPFGEKPLALDVQDLANHLMRLDDPEPSRVLACVVSWSSLYERIRERQHDDPRFLVLKDMVQHSDAKEVSIGDDGDLRQHYLWRRMKKDIVEYVARCLTCQQVKCERQRLGGLIQRLEIPKWKWERVTIDFVVGIPQTLKKFDVVLVIIDRLTKSVHFILVVTTYSSEQLAEILASLKVEIKEYRSIESSLEMPASQGGYLEDRLGDAEQIYSPI